MYIYPDHLKAKATMWLWQLRDLTIVGVGVLLSVLAITQTGIVIKDFTDREIDVIEIMLQKLYQSRGLSDQTDFKLLEPEDYPTLSEMYDFIEAEYKGFDEKKRQLYTADLLQNILLGLHSMCKGAESKFFNRHTNITDSTSSFSG